MELKQPFHHLETIYDIFDAIREKELPATRSEDVTGNISPSLWDLLEDCWSVDPQERPGVDAVVSRLRDSVELRYK